MTWLKKDDGFPRHRKIRRLSDGAYRLHDTALCYAAHDESDGLIRADDIDEMEHGKRLRRHIPDLVAAGLWDEIDGGWLLHDFLDYNPSHAKQEAERKAARDRQAKARAKRLGIPDPDPDEDVSRRDSRVTSPLVTLPVPGRTDPTRPGPFVGGDQDQIVTQVTRKIRDVLDLDARRRGGAAC